MNLQLLLFDIDGTILRCNGAGKTAVIKAMQEEWGSVPDVDEVPFAGMTDRGILMQILTKMNIPRDEMPPIIDKILTRYLTHLPEALAMPNRVEVLPGVADFLTHLSELQLPYGLLTGNIRKGAMMKLHAGGLDHYFSVGAFGDDAINRNLLPPIAIQRASEHFGIDFSPEKVWIIGDTPRDIECGKVNHCKTIAVTTGGYSEAELRAHQPDIVVRDLANWQSLLEKIRCETNHLPE
jgi:phosphoglycolate phosphatase-like HAD superfamily hydrolase